MHTVKGVMVFDWDCITAKELIGFDNCIIDGDRKEVYCVIEQNRKL